MFRRAVRSLGIALLAACVIWHTVLQAVAMSSNARSGTEISEQSESSSSSWIPPSLNAHELVRAPERNDLSRNLDPASQPQRPHGGDTQRAAHHLQSPRDRAYVPWKRLLHHMARHSPGDDRPA